MCQTKSLYSKMLEATLLIKVSSICMRFLLFYKEISSLISGKKFENFDHSGQRRKINNSVVTESSQSDFPPNSD